MSEESLIPRIVDTVSGRVSVLLGAGASAAFGLPTMVSFLEKAYGKEFIKGIESCPPYKIGSNNVDAVKTNQRAVIRRLFHTTSLGKDKVDFDLESLFSFVYNAGLANSSWPDDEHAKRLFWLYRACADGHETTFTGFGTAYGTHQPLLSGWMQDVSDAIADLRRRMHKTFLIDRSNAEVVDNAVHLYGRLFTELFDSQAPVVFTLNFDTVFEAVDDAKSFDWNLVDGIREARRSRYFKFQNFLEELHTGNPLYLFKLHGSVTWSRDNGDLRDTYPGTVPIQDPEAVALAEPVISKQSQHFPFGQMYKIFEATLAQNEVCVVIGTSLRDDNLRSVLERRLAHPHRPFKLILLAPFEKEHSYLNDNLAALSRRKNVVWLKERFSDGKIVNALAKEAMG